jgi:hypothetical protein
MKKKKRRRRRRRSSVFHMGAANNSFQISVQIVINF